MQRRWAATQSAPTHGWEVVVPVQATRTDALNQLQALLRLPSFSRCGCSTCVSQLAHAHAHRYAYTRQHATELPAVAH